MNGLTEEEDGRWQDQVVGRVTKQPPKAPEPEPPKPFPARALRDRAGEPPIIEDQA